VSSPHVLSNKLAKSMAEDTTHDHTSASIPNIITSETPIILYQVIMQPGSKASIPITFTASIDGLFQLLGLVTYASAEDENDVAASRLAHIIHIQPLASLAASVRPAKVDSERYLVEVEVGRRPVISQRLILHRSPIRQHRRSVWITSTPSVHAGPRSDRPKRKH